MENDLFERGLFTRRRIHGEHFVEQALTDSDPVKAEFQRFVTEHCWGAAWSDTAAPLLDKSLVTLGILAAHGQLVEFKLHCRGALRNGYDISALICLAKQIAVYCGITTGISCFNAILEAAAEHRKSQDV